MKNTAKQDRARGFSLIELMMVLVIALIIAAMAIPYFINIVRTYRLRVAATDAMGIVQQGRMRSVQDSRFYSIYYIGANPLQQYYVDIFPKNANGTSGTGGTNVLNGDPVIGIPGEVVPQPVGNAPDTIALKNLFLPGSNVNPYDGFDPTTPISFGAEGVPCLPMGAAQGVVGGSICNTRSNWKNPGAPVAYWLFFQHTINQNWQAVTITPAGRIQRWVYFSGGWSLG
ncbi:MAG TPA: prepilin-type N-terminal cleavage/methylation domain-containing protein [Terriglobales bacterium]|nr:prepilin-type N-terminal cleavage/methylation domain-containing protein [Terriglobales bacterium]